MSRYMSVDTYVYEDQMSVKVLSTVKTTVRQFSGVSFIGELFAYKYVRNVSSPDSVGNSKYFFMKENLLPLVTFVHVTYTPYFMFLSKGSYQITRDLRGSGKIPLTLQFY